MQEMISIFNVSAAEVGFGALIIMLAVWVLLLEMRLRRTTRGSDGKSIEKHIASAVDDYKKFGSFKQTVEDTLGSIDSRLGGSIRGFAVVRFNPFSGNEGNKQSFAIALLSEVGDGLIISTLHARERVSIFTKEIRKFEAQQELIDEERQALEKARNSLHNTTQ
jgi:hypothetical protein